MCYDEDTEYPDCDGRHDNTNQADGAERLLSQLMYRNSSRQKIIGSDPTLHSSTVQDSICLASTKHLPEESSSSLTTQQVSLRNQVLHDGEKIQFEQSDSNSADNMNPPLNRSFLMSRPMQESSSPDRNGPFTSDDTEHPQFGSVDSTDARSEYADDDEVDLHHTLDQTAAANVHLHIGTLPSINYSTTDSLNAAIRRYNDANKFLKPAAPSSVKSFGSNIGSDDCACSLDVETHSVGARSIHSQEDTLPVVIPDPDPETVAVAALSINSVETEIRLDTIYEGRNKPNHQDRISYLTSSQFRQSRLDANDDSRRGTDTDSFPQQQNITQEDISNTKTPSNWNDPRQDSNLHEGRKPQRERMYNVNQKHRRSRSRSRSPST